MNLDLGNYKIHLAFCPVDMRCGYRSLSVIASACLGIDIDQGRDCVVFVSSRRAICKAIWSDETGASMLTRTLRRGRFQHLLAQAQGDNAAKVTKRELLDFLDGTSIQQKKRGFSQSLDLDQDC